MPPAFAQRFNKNQVPKTEATGSPVPCSPGTFVSFPGMTSETDLSGVFRLALGLGSERAYFGRVNSSIAPQFFEGFGVLARLLRFRVLSEGRDILYARPSSVIEIRTTGRSYLLTSLLVIGHVSRVRACLWASNAQPPARTATTAQWATTASLAQHLASSRRRDTRGLKPGSQSV